MSDLRWFSPGTPVSATNKTDCHDITEILLKVALNTINQLTIIKNLLLKFEENQNQSLLFLLSAACLAEKQQVPIL
jgi:hypothetical protein